MSNFSEASSALQSDQPQAYGMIVNAEYDQQRLDNFLVRELKGVPKSKIYRMIRKGEVRINKKRAKPDSRLQTGDYLRIPPVRQAPSQAHDDWIAPATTRAIEACVLFEDERLIILNKLAGWAVHGGSGVSLGVIEALRKGRPHQTLELVHRLDRGTSGCLMVTKKRSALKQLHEALQNGLIKKTYLALVVGAWSKRKTRVDQPLLKRSLPHGGRIVSVDAEGKQARTEFKLLMGHAQASLIRAMPITGRTHQIRVHCQFTGHPIIGDESYGIAVADRAFKAWGITGLCLHAHQLELPWNDKTMTIVAPLPDQFQQAIARLQQEGAVIHEQL